MRGSKDKSKDAPDHIWSPYGCHYQPDMEEFPLPKIDSIPDDPLRAGEQGWKLLSCSHCNCQELCQQVGWLLIGCTRINSQSEARSAS